MSLTCSAAAAASLGFHAAGFEIAAAIESDPDAARSHGLNFHRGEAAHCKARDVTDTGPDELAKELGLGDASLAFDVIVGGPPCQAFARVGRSKLREVADHPEAFHSPIAIRRLANQIIFREGCPPLRLAPSDSRGGRTCRSTPQ